ncbi:ATP-binding cassette domain-containing protein [Candidatus Shapirobacteria bacterium]|nr:ATP-binding cassette domain-containing protein [Candidatus Shapirobacteria bacterium]
MEVIEVSHLRKNFSVFQKEPGLVGSFKSIFFRRYKQVKAVRDISFSIKEGELVGFIGPNGAGKTTTLKCLSGLLYPDGGSVSVLGFQPWQRQPEFQKQFSLVMGQKNQLWWDLPPLETFLLNKEIYDVPQDQFNKTLNELVKLLEVEDILKVQTRKLSLGQRMKCELIAALLHSPKVLFLDEPTIGLDVVMQKKIRDFIKEYNQKFKSTIILTSHYMGDVKELCKRVMIIDKGQLVFDGELAKVVKRYGQNKVISVVLAKEIGKEKLESIDGLREYLYPQATFLVKREKTSQKTAEILEKLPIADLNVEEPPIEEIIRELFTHKNYR